MKKSVLILVLLVLALSCAESRKKSQTALKTAEEASRILYKTDSANYFNALDAFIDHKYDVSKSLLDEIDSISDFNRLKVELIGMINNQIKQDPDWKNYKKIERPAKSTLAVSNSQAGSFTFVLTHALGQRLNPAAHFTVGEHKKWTLDMGNNGVVYYNIISMNKDNMMCGIRSRDSYGDLADICITKKSNDNVSIEIKYGGKRIKYEGYLRR
jgi:hypothetical protein